MSRKLSLDGYLEILSHEAIVIRPYLDTSKVWTIGVGHTAAAGPPDPEDVKRDLTIEEALQLFIDDVPKYEAAVHRFITAPMSQTEFDAWFSFIYNSGGISSKTKEPYTCIPKFNAGNKTAAYSALMTVNNKGKLTSRREKERALMRDGKYSHKGEASVYSASAKGNVLWSQGKRIKVKDGLVRLLQKRSPKPEPAPPPPPPPDMPKLPPVTPPSERDKASTATNIMATVIFAAVVIIIVYLAFTNL